MYSYSSLPTTNNIMWLCHLNIIKWRDTAVMNLTVAPPINLSTNLTAHWWPRSQPCYHQCEHAMQSMIYVRMRVPTWVRSCTKYRPSMGLWVCRPIKGVLDASVCAWLNCDQIYENQPCQHIKITWFFKFVHVLSYNLCCSYTYVHIILRILYKVNAAFNGDCYRMQILLFMNK